MSTIYAPMYVESMEHFTRLAGEYLAAGHAALARKNATCTKIEIGLVCEMFGGDDVPLFIKNKPTQMMMLMTGETK